MDAQGSPVLSASNVDLHYGSVHILQGISVDIGALPRAIIGRNGMGKTSLCRPIMGLLPLSGGNINLNGVAIDHQAPDWRAHHGLAYVPQGRRVFPTLTVAILLVEQNLSYHLFKKFLHVYSYSRTDQSILS